MGSQSHRGRRSETAGLHMCRVWCCIAPRNRPAWVMLAVHCTVHQEVKPSFQTDGIRIFLEPVVNSKECFSGFQKMWKAGSCSFVNALRNAPKHPLVDEMVCKSYNIKNLCKIYRMQQGRQAALTWVITWINMAMITQAPEVLLQHWLAPWADHKNILSRFTGLSKQKEPDHWFSTWSSSYGMRMFSMQIRPWRRVYPLSPTASTLKKPLKWSSQ